MKKISIPVSKQSLTVQHGEGEKKNQILNFLRNQKKWRVPALILSFLGIVVFGAVLFFIWFRVIPNVWQWGFDKLSLKAIPAALSFLFLGSIPLGLVWLPISTAGKILGLYIEDQEYETKQELRKVNVVQTKVEDQLEKEDVTGLIPLVRYSRVQLEAYYTIGLKQTQRSFRYSIIAMWIGFIIIVGGILHYVVPLEKLGITPIKTDINVLILAGGGIIELISALFLWVYRNSIAQLTYFYNRQMHTHNILLCYRIADSMQSKDETKKIIVEKVLERTWTLDRPAMRGAKGITKLISKAN